ncbi:MAG: tRNA (adenosine(37)-N6)-threonylcarbamoyltransferase complex ATPase subunit type 1 TsaE, partial [Pseudomonadota bacterium]
MDVFATHMTNNEAESLDLAAQLAKSLKSDDIVMLNGPLGAGKSVLARGIIRNLSHNPEEDIPSPTFTLVQQY